MYDVSIRTIPQTALVGVSHLGSYMEINRAFETLFGTIYARGLARPDMRMIGIYFDDPDIVPTDKLRSIACATVHDDFPADAPLTYRQLDGGACAVLRHKGPYADMHKAYQWFYGSWLPQSGREVRDAPRFEEYLNNPRDVPPTELLTDIYMPLVAG